MGIVQEEFLMSLVSTLKITTAAAGALILAACASAGSSSTGNDTMGPAAGTQAHFTANVGDRVFFGFDRYNVTAAGQRTLQDQATWLNAYPSAAVLVEGHCDERGTREYNLALGDRRAVATRDALVALGIDSGRISTISYGKERPAALGSNEEAWSLNRRGVTVVTTPATM